MKVSGQSFSEQVLSLREMWASTIPGDTPAIQQFGTWLMIHNRNADRVEWAIRELAIKLTKKEMGEEHKVRFAGIFLHVSASTFNKQSRY